MENTRADIGILTVIPAELDAALKALPPLVRTTDENTGTVYWQGTIHSEITNHDYEVVLSCIGEPGNPTAAAAATELLMTYKPRAILLMGIAAGIRDKVKIGDVVLSERVVAYEPAALATTEDGAERIEPRPEIDRIPHRMRQQIVNYRSDERRLGEAFHRMGGEFPKPPPGEEEKYAKHVSKVISAKSSTIGSGEKLLRNQDKIKSLRNLHGKLEVVEMEAAGLVDAARRPNVPWLVVRGISDFGDESKNDEFHTFASKAAAVVLVDFIVHGLDIGRPPPPPGWGAAERTTEQWNEETRDVIGKDVRIPREDLMQRIIESVQNERVTVLLGESGSGKSALVKSIYNSGAFPTTTLALPAQEATELVRSYDLDAVIKAKPKGDRLLLVIDGLDRATGSEALRLIARLLRALDLSSEASSWRLLLTCQAAQWERCRQDMVNLNVPLTTVKVIPVQPFDKSEVDRVAQEVQDIAPALLREDLLPVMGRPKILDLVACAAAHVGLPDVAQWVGESNLIEWTWEKFICGGERDTRHSGLLQSIAVRQADERLFAIPIMELSAPDRALLDDLGRVGILIKRQETIRFAHDLYADYARQRYLLALVSDRRLAELKSRLTNPLWHRSIRLVSLHLLEYRDAERAPDVDSWRRLVRALDERVTFSTPDDGSGEGDAPPGAGVDLLLEGIAFAAQPGNMLDAIIDDLTASHGALLRSFLFRFGHAAIELVPLRNIVKRPRSDLGPDVDKMLNLIVHLPNYPLWSRVLEWMGLHAQQVISLAPWEFLDSAEYWFQSTLAFEGKLFEGQDARVLARLIVDLAERMIATGDRYSYHTESAKRRVRLYQMMLLCGLHESERVRVLVRILSGLNTEDIANRRVSRSSIVPPDYVPRVKKPQFWPKGPKSAPNEQFRQAALTMPGAEWIAEIDPEFASDVFLALLIEVPDPDRDYDALIDRGGFHFDSWRYVRPPFWDFPPAQCLLAKNPEIAIDFIVQVADFATDRWAEHWPHIARAGWIGEQIQADVPRMTLVVDGIAREYVGDARVLEWHQGGSQGPDAAAATLMSLEHWLYTQDEESKLEGPTLKMILLKTHSVAILGVLFELALKNPAYLLGPLEPFVASPELYLWGRARTNQVRDHARAALIAWTGEPQERINGAHEWHSLQHRERDFIRVIMWLLARRGFDWPMLCEARRMWVVIANQTSDARMRRWIQDVMLPSVDKDNWRSTAQPDGTRTVEYIHPEEIEQRQSEVRRSIQEWAVRRHFPLRCRRILNGEETIDEQTLVEILEFASGPLDRWTKEEIWLMGGSWTPRCGAAAVAILRFECWLKTNPDWHERCERWIIEACSLAPQRLMYEPSIRDTAWDSFCAEVLPVLWARVPEDKTLRRSLAYLVAAPHHDARRRLFATLARRRTEYIDDFGRLLYLSIWTARLMMLYPGHVPEHMDPASKQAGVERCFLRLAEEFVEARLAQLPRDWAGISDAQPEDLELNPYGAWDGFQDGVIVESFAWLAEQASGYQKARDREFLGDLVEGLTALVPIRLMHSYDEKVTWRLDAPVTSAPPRTPVRADRGGTNTDPDPTRKGWLGVPVKMIRSATHGLLALVRGGGRSSRAKAPSTRPILPPRRRHAIGTPRQTDYDIAGLIALFLVRETDSARRHRILEPWLELRGSCHYWIDLLLDNMYIAATGVEERDSVFLSLMREVFDHALRQDGWLDERSHHVSDIGRALLGFGSLARGEFWSVERAPTAIGLREYWPRWVDVAISWHLCAPAFIRMLRKPAFDPLRPSCLHWLVRSAPGHWMSDESQVALIRFLELVWGERHREGHELTGPLRNVFEQLLRELVARHVPDAVQLSARVGRNE